MFNSYDSLPSSVMSVPDRIAVYLNDRASPNWTCWMIGQHDENKITVEFWGTIWYHVLRQTHLCMYTIDPWDTTSNNAWFGLIWNMWNASCLWSTHTCGHMNHNSTHNTQGSIFNSSNYYTIMIPSNVHLQNLHDLQVKIGRVFSLFMRRSGVPKTLDLVTKWSHDFDYFFG